MINLHDIRYLRIGTRDIETSIKFATEIVGLQLVSREGKTAYFRSDKVQMRGDTRDHSLVLFEGNPADQSIGLELHDPNDIDKVGAVLEAAGHAVHFGTAAECEQRRARAFIATKDPSGNKIEIVARPYHSGARFFPSRDAGITGFSHIGLFSTDTKRDTKFWSEICSGRISDWIGDTTFLRINTQHHSVVLTPSRGIGIQHINHQVEDIDDVMRSYYFLRERNIKIIYGPGRHPISTAVMVYFEGPDGMVFEYSCDVRHILPEEEATYRPRQFSLDHVNGCMWGSRAFTDGLPREARHQEVVNTSRFAG
jgi:2,3-dihydroxy-p-cumate/2,3-dihydroxybenzoate 3,4-dioxygenase